MAESSEQWARAYSKAWLAASDREAAFNKWWKLSIHNGTLPKTREALAREAYYAAWGGALTAREQGK